MKSIIFYLRRYFFWRRYAVDVFLIAKKIDFNDIISFANHISSDIQFTLEMEVNNSIPFLDIFITHNCINSIVIFCTTVFRKKIRLMNT